MSQKKVEKYRQMDDEELHDELTSLKKDLMYEYGRKTQGYTDIKSRRIRKNIARVKTIINERR